jgi:hypothetical protein
MRTSERRERLILDLIRLRQAERTYPTSEEIAAVRADLEEMIGPTIARATAARLLGVSQTALERWIATGDVPILIALSGRREMPLRALVELIEAVSERRKKHPGDRHPLGSVLRARRAQAEQLDVSTLLDPANRRDETRRNQDKDKSTRRDAEQRGLAYHRAVAKHMDERTIRDARDQLARWRSQRKIDQRYAQRWEEILATPPAQIAKVISQDTLRMHDLRQNSPFAGALTEPERRRVLAAVNKIGT